MTGALIVIEREIGLRTLIESGVPLDANLSYDLLVTIFRPSAPLHDGAVIVQKNRIAAAACFLPLSMNPVLSTQYGTRHRAGHRYYRGDGRHLGRRSEETGSISLAVGGAIERDITVEYLRAAPERSLRSTLSPAPRPCPPPISIVSLGSRQPRHGALCSGIAISPTERSADHASIYPRVHPEEPALQDRFLAIAILPVVGHGCDTPMVELSLDGAAGISRCPGKLEVTFPGLSRSRLG